MKACFHSVRVTTQQRFNTARLAARLDERSEFRQYLGACPEEPLLPTEEQPASHCQQITHDRMAFVDNDRPLHL